MTRELQILQLVHLLNNPWYALAFAIFAAWTIAWKGIALWKAARNNSSVWFVVLLLVNTLGVLEILYVFFFSANKKEIK